MNPEQNQDELHGSVFGGGVAGKGCECMLKIIRDEWEKRDTSTLQKKVYHLSWLQFLHL